MTNHIVLKLNTDLGKFKKNLEIKLDSDHEGIPYDYYWQNRMRDSSIDNCVSLISISEGVDLTYNPFIKRISAIENANKNTKSK